MSSHQPCPVSVQVYATIKASGKLRDFAIAKGHQVTTVRAEFNDVAVFTVTISEKVKAGDGFGTLTGLGSFQLIRELSEAGGFSTDPEPVVKENCVANSFYAMTAPVKRVIGVSLFEFGSEGGRKAIDAARRLALPASLYVGPESVIVRVAHGSTKYSFFYRAQRGDFGPIRGLGSLASPEAIKASRQQPIDLK